MRVRPLGFAVVLLASALGLGAVACAAVEEDDTASADSAYVWEYHGSWSIATADGRGLEVPNLPFRTVASLIVRPDGTFYAQLAPRAVAGTHYVDETRSAEVGAWQGREGRWILSPLKPKGGRTLTLASYGQPTITLDITIKNGVMQITDPSYAGALTGKTDLLKKVPNDCRVENVVKGRQEVEADAIEQEVLGLGTPRDQPSPYTMNLVGKPPRPDAQCSQPISESSLRFVWKDAKSGQIRAVRHAWSDLTSANGASAYAQTYVYDANGILRLVTTTVAEGTLGAEPAAAMPGEAGDAGEETDGGATAEAAAAAPPIAPTIRIRQERTYFDPRGVPLRTLMQPNLEQALVASDDVPFTGRRFKDLSSPIGVVDLPLCPIPAAEARRIASAPNDPAASLAAPPVCSPR